MTARPHPDQVTVMLAARALELATYLLPGGKVEGGEYRGKGPGGATWGVALKGGRVGYWLNFGDEASAGKSLLGLIRELATEGDHKRAYWWALEWLGEDVCMHQPPPRQATPPNPTPEEPREDGRAQWLAAQPFAWTSPVGLYLQARGIDPAKIGHAPGALRFHPAYWCDEARTKLPAMLTAIVHPIRHHHMALHRTWLECRGGVWRKADLAKPKKMLGSYKGGFVPLTRGATGRPWPKALEGEAIGLAEGIENALSAAMDEPDIRWAAYGSANNLPALQLPPVFRHVVLARDRDGENWDVRDSRERAIGAWQDQEREVSWWEPPLDVKDANDFIRGGVPA